MKNSRFIISLFVVFFSYNAFSEKTVDFQGDNIHNRAELSMIVQSGDVDGFNTVGKKVKLPAKTFILTNENNLMFCFPYKCAIEQYHRDWAACLFPATTEKSCFVILNSGACPYIDIFDFKLKNISRIRNAQTLNEFAHEIKNIMEKDTFKMTLHMGHVISPTSFESLETDESVCLFFISYKKPFFIRCNIRTGEIFKEFYLSDFFSRYCPENVKKVIAPAKEVSPSDLYHSWKECSDERINISGDIINKARIAGLYYRYWGEGISREAGFSIIKKSLIEAIILKKAAERSGILATPLLVKEEMNKANSKLPVSEQQKLDKMSQVSGYKNFEDYIQRISEDKYIQEMFAISKYLEPQISVISVNIAESDTYYKENLEKIKRFLNFPEKAGLPAPTSIVINFIDRLAKSGENQNNISSFKSLKTELIAGKPDSIQQLLTRFDIEVEENVDNPPVNMSQWQKVAGSDNILIGDLYSSNGKEKLPLLIVGSWQEVYYRYASKMLLKEKIENKIREIIEIGKKDLSVSVNNEPSDFKLSKHGMFDKPLPEELQRLKIEKAERNAPIKELFTEAELKTLSFCPESAGIFKSSYEEALFYDHSGDYVKALKCLTKSANDENNFRAEFKLGEYYKYGRKGIDRKPEVGNTWYQKAIVNIEQQKQQTPEMLWILGCCYKEGSQGKSDSGKVIKFFKEAVQQNYGPALSSLAECYYDGYGVKQDMPASVELLKKAVSADDGRAMALLGSWFLSGPPESINEGLVLIKRSILKYDPVGQYSLGLAYLRGTGLKKNQENAVFWLQKSADQGYPWAVEILTKIRK